MLGKALTPRGEKSLALGEGASVTRGALCIPQKPLSVWFRLPTECVDVLPTVLLQICFAFKPRSYRASKSGLAESVSTVILVVQLFDAQQIAQLGNPWERVTFSSGSLRLYYEIVLSGQINPSTDVLAEKSPHSGFARYSCYEDISSKNLDPRLPDEVRG